jgi:hypothetical protein
MSNDPDYLNCTKSECQERVLGKCLVSTCSGSLTFHNTKVTTFVTVAKKSHQETYITFNMWTANPNGNGRGLPLNVLIIYLVIFYLFI